MRISKILLPVDFSALCDGAAHYVKTLACRFDSEVTIAHVFELYDAMIRAPEVSLPPSWYEERRAEFQRLLEDFHVDEFRNLRVRRMLLEGDVARTIIDLAHHEEMDLIVMPTHGYRRFRRFILGSVTAKILHDADCPVLTGVHILDSPILEPIFFRNIICAVDLDAAGDKTLGWASQFAAEFQARLILVHALPGANLAQAQYYDQALPMMLRKLGQEQLDDLQKRVGTAAEAIVEAGAVAEVVHNAVIAQKGDLVVIGRHASSGLLGRLRTNAYSIVRESPCPVVSV